MVAAVVSTLVPDKHQYIQRAMFFQSPAAVAMDNSGVQDIFILDVEGIARLACRITVATNALAAFVLQALFHPADATWYTLRSTAGQFTSPTGILVDTSGDLTAQASGTTGWFVLDCAGFSKLKIQSNSSGASSTMALSGGGL